MVEKSDGKTCWGSSSPIYLSLIIRIVHLKGINVRIFMSLRRIGVRRDEPTHRMQMQRPGWPAECSATSSATDPPAERLRVDDKPTGPHGANWPSSPSSPSASASIFKATGILGSNCKQWEASSSSSSKLNSAKSSQKLPVSSRFYGHQDKEQTGACGSADCPGCATFTHLQCHGNCTHLHFRRASFRNAGSLRTSSCCCLDCSSSCCACFSRSCKSLCSSRCL